MYIDMSAMIDIDRVKVSRASVDGQWRIDFGVWGFIMLPDAELDALKYEIDSAVFERDMGLEYGAHANDNTLMQLVHGADEGGKQ
jgi:hypothetical protein